MTIFELLHSSMEEKYIVRRIKDYLPYLNDKDECDNSVLMNAIHLEQTLVIKKLLSLHHQNPNLFDINSFNCRGENALILASQSHIASCLELLIDYHLKNHCLNINFTSNQKNSFLYTFFDSLSFKKVQLFNTLLQTKEFELDFNVKNKEGHSPLFNLVLTGFSTLEDEKCRILLLQKLIEEHKNGHIFIDFAAQDSNGLNVFLFFCSLDNVTNFLPLFLEHHALFDIHSYFEQQNALVISARYNPKLFEPLIESPLFHQKEFLLNALEHIDDDLLKNKVNDLILMLTEKEMLDHSLEAKPSFKKVKL